METKILDCGHAPTFPHGIGTGYGIQDGKTACYKCCAEGDKTRLRETGKLSGYFVRKDMPNPFNEGGSTCHFAFTNWTGHFSIPVLGIRKSWHNFAGKNGRTDFWCWFEGKCYHGVQIGHDNQCASIKLLKKQPK